MPYSVRLRARRLTCFYCGRKTSTLYDGRTRQFDCPNCEATNYLDEKGEITDPPIETTDPASTPIRYGRPRLPLSSSYRSLYHTDPVFCQKCLSNQHLFTASLAQYLPDDPSDPDYTEREKSYLTFRRGLEKRYPQVCEKCAPRVRARIAAAGYTARTEALRRKLDLAAEHRKFRRRGYLDGVDWVGGKVRRAGIVLQVVWHFTVVGELVRRWAGGVDAPSWMLVLMRMCGAAIGFLPDARSLITWSLMAGVLSLWWNPRFLETARGFTKHLVGLRTFYLCQVAAVAMRGSFLRGVDLAGGEGVDSMTQIGAHVVAVGVSLLLHISASRSVRVDSASLFTPSDKQQSSLQLPPDTREDQAEEDNNKSMAQILEEIMQESPQKSLTEPASPASAYNTAVPDFSQDVFIPPRSHRTTVRPAPGPTQPPAVDSLHLSDRPSVQYAQEMDWSPTQSRYQAFNTQGQVRRKGFGQVAPEAKGPFWFRVPPAPTTPAQRLYNPPNPMRMRQSPVQKQDIMFRGANGTHLDRNVAVPKEEAARQVVFAESSFFVPPARNDPRNGLSDKFGGSFKLDEQEEKERREQEAGSWGTSLWGLLSGKGTG